nr:polysaccharide pyruvyl transferase family protein [Pseudoalteromonas sp. TB13]
MNAKFKRIKKETDFLYWWKPGKKFKIFPKKLNVGDALSAYIVWNVMQEKGGVKYTNRMLAIGSILNHGRTGDTIWGTGYNSVKADSTYIFEDLDVHAVRGPLTKRFLEKKGVSVPEVYGDPGILASRYFSNSDIKDIDYLVIPHISENKNKFIAPNVLETKGCVEKFMKKIVRAKKVISSSLHGIIIAESFGIEAVLLKNNNGEGNEKYQDYYLGTGRSDYPICKSLEEALIVKPPILPEVAVIQERLLSAFPA